MTELSEQEMAPKNQKLLSWLLVIGFIIAGAGTLYLSGIQVKQAWATKSWPTVEGTIESSSTSVDYTGDKKAYVPDIRYLYVVGGKHYTGTHIRYGSQAQSSSRRGAERIAKRYREGTKVTVYRNPDDPNDALLEPGMHLSSLLWPAVGVLILILGILMLARVIRRGSLW